MKAERNPFCKNHFETFAKHHVHIVKCLQWINMYYYLLDNIGLSKEKIDEVNVYMPIIHTFKNILNNQSVAKEITYFSILFH